MGSNPSRASAAVMPTPVAAGIPLWRVLAVFGMVALVYLIVAGRLVQLQVLHHEEHAAAVNRTVTSAITVRGRRGRILDRRERPLALSVEAVSCAIDPKLCNRAEGGLDSVLRDLGVVLALSPERLALIRRRARREGCRFVWVKRNLKETEREALGRIELPGVVRVRGYRRFHPGGRLAGHVLGFTDIDGKGLDGMERVCEAVLKGLDEKQPILRDALRRPLTETSEALASRRSGMDVRLTLDATIQAIAERHVDAAFNKWRASAVCAVVMEPCSGDVLALVNRPDYHPDRPTLDPTAHRLNQAVSTVFEPGSIMKPIAIGKVVDAGLATWSTTFHCENGAWRMPGGRVLRDTHGYGPLSVEMILVKSSNIGTAKVAALLGPARLHRALTDFGFGRSTGIGLPGEIGAQLHPLRKWTSYSMGSVPMGQEVTVTPLQITTAFCAIANGGMLLKPRIALDIREENGAVVHAAPVKPVARMLRPETAARLRAVLRKVVTHGTGRRLKQATYEIAGKTGTAQLAVNAEEYAAGHRGYSPDRYVGSFIGFAPYDNPRLVVLVSVREPKGAYYGGTVAGPAVREILDESLRYLRVPLPASAGEVR